MHTKNSNLESTISMKYIYYIGKEIQEQTMEGCQDYSFWKFIEDPHSLYNTIGEHDLKWICDIFEDDGASKNQHILFKSAMNVFGSADFMYLTSNPRYLFGFTKQLLLDKGIQYMWEREYHKLFRDYERLTCDFNEDKKEDTCMGG